MNLSIFKNKIMILKVTDGSYQITAYRASIIKTAFVRIGKNFDTSFHAVVLKPEALKSEGFTIDNSMELKTEGSTKKDDNTCYS